MLLVFFIYYSYIMISHTLYTYTGKNRWYFHNWWDKKSYMKEHMIFSHLAMTVYLKLHLLGLSQFTVFTQWCRKVSGWSHPSAGNTFFSHLWTGQIGVPFVGYGHWRATHDERTCRPPLPTYYTTDAYYIPRCKNIKKCQSLEW